MLTYDDRLPFVDKSIVRYLKELYDNRYLFELCKHEGLTSDTALGFMMGVQQVIDRLDAISTKEDD